MVDVSDYDDFNDIHFLYTFYEETDPEDIHDCQVP